MKENVKMIELMSKATKEAKSLHEDVYNSFIIFLNDVAVTASCVKNPYDLYKELLFSRGMLFGKLTIYWLHMRIISYEEKNAINEKVRKIINDVEALMLKQAAAKELQLV